MPYIREFLPSLRRFAVAIGIGAVVAGTTVIVGGWWAELRLLTSIMPGLATMKVNTALAIALLGAALSLPRETAIGRRAATAAAAIATGIGAVTLLEYASGQSLGIDQLLFLDANTPAAMFPGRPAAATALSLTLMGIGLLVTGSRVGRGLKTATTLLAILISWLALIGYLFGARSLYQVVPYGSMAVHTALLCFLLGVGILLTKPICWPTWVILGKGTGGIVARRLLPAAALAPPILGWLVERGALHGSYTSVFGWALVTALFSAGSAMLILLLAHRIETATELSLHDPLTGLANRRAFDSFLKEVFDLARRHRHPLSLLMLDVDHFKSYNDTFGHPAGDELLVKLSGVLGALSRSTDLVARIGGEEFAIVLPETDLVGACILAERARTGMEHSSDMRRPVTISVGVASLDEAIPDAAALVRRCDAELYRAKRMGRNVVAVTAAAGSDNEPSRPAMGRIADN